MPSHLTLAEFVPRDGVSSIAVQDEREVENKLRKTGDEQYKAVELERERQRKKMVRPSSALPECRVTLCRSTTSCRW